MHTHTHTGGGGVIWPMYETSLNYRKFHEIIVGYAEYDVLIHHTADLQITVRTDLIGLGAQLVSAQIITPDQYEKIRNIHQSVDERAADLVGYVQIKVRQDPQYYNAFIDALRRDLSQYAGILTKLEDSFNNHPLTMAMGQQSSIQQGTCIIIVIQ